MKQFIEHGHGRGVYFLNFFNIVIPDMFNSLPFFMIANMITGLLNRSPAPSQVIIGVMLKGKHLIRHLNRFGVVCLSNGDDLRFRWSAATDSLKVTIRELVMEKILASNHTIICMKDRLSEWLTFYYIFSTNTNKKVLPFNSRK